MPSLEKTVDSLGSKGAPKFSISTSERMGFPFSLVAELLEECCSNLDADSIAETVVDWFQVNRKRIQAPGCNLAALLSTLLPEKRTDRVYCIKTPRLQKLFVGALGIGKSRLPELEAYKEPGRGLDLADCVEQILKQTPNPAQSEESRITVEEIDEILHGIASRISFSSPSIRASVSTPNRRRPGELDELYRLLSPLEAKWLTRLVLKDFLPLVLKPNLIYRLCHQTLPFIMNIRDDFKDAIETLEKSKIGTLTSGISAAGLDRESMTTIKPRLSIKVGRQLWFKARSIKHCLDMCQGKMSVEKKMDGEYCQIHIDASKGKGGIQIFSKSGKDSTEDRKKLHDFIAESLKLGQPECSVKTECILEGELLVFSDPERKILPFHHIRNHVTRRGRYIHPDYESRPRPGEHLMIVYYDMLLLDGESLLDKKHSERFRLLEKTIYCSSGRAEIVQRQIIDTGHRLGASALRNAFAKEIREKGEGLVLKADLPYFNFRDHDLPFNGKCIKLKKDYIGAFGDVGDFAVVGAGYNPRKAKSYGIPHLKWTHFFIGCLGNKEEVKRWAVKPKFTVVNEIELNATMLKTFLAHGATLSVPVPEADNRGTIIKRNRVIEVSGPLNTAFESPPVLDVRCFSFEKMADTGFWGLRFPTASKIHFDRDFTDTISFDELQVTAEKAILTPDMEDSQENLAWIAKLEGADPRGVAVDASTQETTTTGPSPSPVKPSPAPSSCPSTMSIGSMPLRRGQDALPREKHALSQGSDATPPRPTKRCQTRIADDHHHQHGASSTQDGGIPSRQPLEEIDLNSTQGSQQSCSAFTEAPALSFSESQIGLLSTLKPLDPAKSFSIEGVENAAPSQTSTITSEAAPTDGLAGEAEPLGTTRPRPAPQAPGLCRFVGSQCPLAKKVVLLDSSLQTHQSADLRALLEDHGLTERILDPVSWVAEDRLRSLSAKEWRPGRGALLLVDGLEKKTETKELISAMEKMRHDIPKRHRNWIRVFDWRVLKHISIMEDEDIPKKYYDGFSSPWQRWSFGLI